RLRVALEVLPDCENLTRLALSVGYSSHSHFSWAFRREYATTPSAVRRHLRSGDLGRLVPVARTPFEGN
ncbi:MAG: helix-turn-helix domain-containing protein, partial [Gemmatimonadota bacterium]|nr:helix-turn-helix domain-containing protein [Gemmatimonadota bacterium]